MPARSSGLNYALKASISNYGMMTQIPKLRRRLRSTQRATDPRVLEQEILSKMIPHQRAFMEDYHHKYIALCGGYGCLSADSLVEVWDGVRYVPRPIALLSDAPFQVKTLAGPAWALPAYRKGRAALYRVRLEDGRELKATKDHRCLSPAGWVEVGRLAEGSLIAVDGRPGDTCFEEKARGCSRFDPLGPRSCDAPRHPWEVFVQSQIGQPVWLGSGLHRQSQIFAEGLPFLAERPWLLANLQLVETLSTCVPAGHSELQVLASQSWSLDILLLYVLSREQSYRTLSFHEKELLVGLQQGLYGLLHSAEKGSLLSTPELVAQGFVSEFAGRAVPRRTVASWALDREEFVTQLNWRHQESSQWQNPSSPGPLNEESRFELNQKLQMALNPTIESSNYTWSRVESVTPIGDDFYYDFHVPLLNHYVANGIVHHNSGKSVAAVGKSILLSLKSPGFTGIFLEPTIPLLRDVAIPAWEEFLDRFSIPYSFRGSPLPNFTLRLPGGETTVFLRSLENVERLIGVNAAWIVADEIDTVKEEIATRAIVKLQGRVRVGNCRQIGFATTPEGYRFMHNFFVREASSDKRLIRAKTTDNPYLDPEYAENLRRQYPPQLVESYLNGEFVNLSTATVYAEYNRHSHKTAVIGPDHDEIVFVGADFNIGRSMSVYGVIRAERGAPVLHIFGEYQANDTFGLAQFLRRQYTNQILLNKLIVYPDASGGRMQTSSTTTDHQILRDAGIRVVPESRNPPIQETIQHVNALLHNAQIRVNTSTCPQLVACCEEWGYDDSLKPEKGTGSVAHDHVGDALRYLAWGAFPRGTKARSGPRWR
jgi:hypothetical protein